MSAPLEILQRSFGSFPGFLRMFSRSSLSWFFALLLCCTLAAGCKTRLGQALAYRGPNAPPRIALADEPDDREMEKTAEAHAHYAAGVIAGYVHELSSRHEEERRRRRDESHDFADRPRLTRVQPQPCEGA